MQHREIIVNSFYPSALINIKDKYFVIDNGKWIEVDEDVKIIWKRIELTGKLWINPTYVIAKKSFNVLSSKKNKYYIVTYDGAKWKCNCIRNSAFRKQCRHITEIKQKKNK